MTMDFDMVAPFVAHGLWHGSSFWRSGAFLWVSTCAGRSRLPDPPAWPGTQRDTVRVGGRL